ncbi:hypothetical protein DFH28DRAFT_1125796 [Melampsora americana]|nr:hypothetical protein DFH28DRAFT_1125796 [Melampsora americana]
MPLQAEYRTAHVEGFGFVRWKTLSVRKPLIPDWVIAQYIVLYIEDSKQEPPPKNRVKSIPFPDWDDTVWVNISIPLASEIEVIIV